MADEWYNIPEELRALDQWMVSEKTGKQPISVLSGFAADKTDPRNWVDFETAKAYAEAHGLYIGFCPHESNGIVIVDFDGKKAGREYDPELWAARVEYYKSIQHGYMERSKSGKGYHAVVRASLNRGMNIQKAGIEFYGHRAYVVMTGWQDNDAPPKAVINDYDGVEWWNQSFPARAGTDELDIELRRELTAEEQAENQAFLDWAATWKNANNIKRWFECADAQEDGDLSKGDLALMQLFYKFAKDEQRAIDMFVRSPRAKLLGRKQDAPQYLRLTLARAKEMVDNDTAKAPEGLKAAADKAYDQYMAQKAAEAATQAAKVINHAAGAPVAKLPGMPAHLSKAIKPAESFEFLTADDLRQEKPLSWCIKGLFPAEGVGAIYGDSGSGKSFLTLDMMAAVAEGKRWYGHRTIAMPVLYMALEGGGGMRQRIMAWEKQHGRPYPEGVGIYRKPFDIRDRDRLGALCAALNNGHDRFDGLIVIDTLNQAAPGADENSSRDMGELLAAVRYIQERMHSMVVLVHHSTKAAENKSMRGHGSFFAACDGVIEVRREDEGLRSWNVAKAKDGEDGKYHEFELVTHQLGMDRDRDIITSCAAVEIAEEVQIDESTGREVATSGAPSGNRAEDSPRGERRAARQQSKKMVSKIAQGSRPDGAGMGKPGRKPGGGKNQQLIVRAFESAASAAGVKDAVPLAGGRVCVQMADVAMELRKSSPDGGANFSRDIQNLVSQGRFGFERLTSGEQWLWLLE